MRGSALIDDFACGDFRQERIVLGLKLQRQDIERDPLGYGARLSAIFQREREIHYRTLGLNSLSM